jgi:hypothetical protein
VIREYAQRYALRTLVETGTYLGDAIQANLRNFSRIYSIELGEDLWKRSVRRFKGAPHVTILHGDSAAVLPRVVEGLREPALFWLDGHFSGGITAQGPTDTPVLVEVATVLSHPFEHVVLIDDVRCFVGKDGYPTLSALEAFVRERKPGCTFTVRDDIARVVPR